MFYVYRQIHLCSCKERWCVRREGLCGTQEDLDPFAHFWLLFPDFPLWMHPSPILSSDKPKWIRMKPIWALHLLTGTIGSGKHKANQKLRRLLLGLIKKSLQLLVLVLPTLSCYHMGPETEDSAKLGMRQREKSGFDCIIWSQRHLKPDLLRDLGLATSFRVLMQNKSKPLVSKAGAKCC